MTRWGKIALAVAVGGGLLYVVRRRRGGLGAVWPKSDYKAMRRLSYDEDRQLPERVIVNSMPMVRVHVDIPEKAAELLSNWASIGRTIDSAVSGIDNCKGWDSDTDAEIAEIAQEALVKLKPPIHYMHDAVRNELWKLTGAISPRKPLLGFHGRRR